MKHATFRLWRDRARPFFLGAGGTLVTGLLGVVRNKWVATHLGAAGIGAYAQLVSAQQVLGAVAGLGLGMAVARGVGAALGRRDEAGARAVTRSGLVLVCGAIGVLTPAALLAADVIAEALLGAPGYAGALRIAIIGSAAIALFTVVNGALEGRSIARATLTFSLAGGTAATIATLLLVPRLGVGGAVLGATLVYAAGVAALLLVHRGALHIRPEAGPGATPKAPRAATRPDASPPAGALLRTGAAAMFLVVLELGTLLAVRTHYLRRFGVESNGLAQAALALAQQVGAVFSAYLMSYAFGRVSMAGAAEGAGAVRDITRRLWTAIALVAAPLVAFSMIAATPLLHLLYSERFDPARPLMAVALLGEFARIGFRTCTLGALPLGGARLWLLAGIVQPLALGATYALLAAGGAGPLSLPQAYAASGVISWLVGLLLMRRHGVTLAPRGLLLGVAATGLLTLLAVSIARAA